MTVQTLGKEYRNENAAINALEAEIARLERQQQLDEGKVRSMLGTAGCASVDELIGALAGFASPALRRKVGAAKTKTAARKKTSAGKKRATKKAAPKKTTKKAVGKVAAKKVAKKSVGKRASKKVASKKAVKKTRASRGTLTAAKVEEMKEAFAAKMPGKEIATKFGISHSTVHNVKKRLGLTGK